MNEKVYLKPLLLFGGDTPGGGDIELPGSILDPGDNPLAQSIPDPGNPNAGNGAPVEMP